MTLPIEVGVGVQGTVDLVAPQIDLDWNVPDLFDVG